MKITNKVIINTDNDEKVPLSTKRMPLNALIRNTSFCAFIIPFVNRLAVSYAVALFKAKRCNVTETREQLLSSLRNFLSPDPV